MDISIIINSKIFIGIVSAVGGIAVTVMAQYILNKRGIFSYNVFHNRVGISTEDAIYGSVKVTWNENPVAHLYLSTVELTNQSMKDYESVVVRIYTSNTKLLTQRTEIAGTTRLIDFSEDYKKEIAVREGDRPSDSQFNLFRSRRDYFVTTMNRGQMLRFQFLNAAISEHQPNIWVDVLHKGVKCKFRIAKNLVFGVPQPEAALVGTFVGLIAVGLIIIFLNSITLAALLSFIIGLFVIIPGAYSVKVLRKIRDWLAG